MPTIRFPVDSVRAATFFLAGLLAVPVPYTGRAEVLPPGAMFRDCAACPEMVAIPSGRFAMGTPNGEEARHQVPVRLRNRARPVHDVTITCPFALSRREITFREWTACEEGNFCKGYNRNLKASDLPMPAWGFTWHDADLYTRWLAERTGFRYRLPTEAEWEYAARAGTSTAYYWGEEVGRNRANCLGCGVPGKNRSLMPGGSFPPNLFGLYDLLGNLSEWVADCYADGFVGAPADGTAVDRTDCRTRAIRGGSFISGPWTIRASRRAFAPPDFGHRAIGFRVARELTGVACIEGRDASGDATDHPHPQP